MVSLAVAGLALEHAPSAHRNNERITGPQSQAKDDSECQMTFRRTGRRLQF